MDILAGMFGIVRWACCVLLLMPLYGGDSGFQLLYSFTGANGDGNGPFGNPAIGSDGTIYGTTEGGGLTTSACPFYDPSGCGTVFKLTPPKSAGEAWTETVLYQFTGQNGNGFWPHGGVVIGAHGELYGTTEYGGDRATSANGNGTVFRLTPPESPGGAWTETILYAFTGQNGDGITPSGGLVIGEDGSLYGLTTWGGRVHNQCGTAFKLAPATAAGEAWTETVIHNFGESGDGCHPVGALAIGSQGQLYGATGGGGEYGYGTVFLLVQELGGNWTEVAHYNFTIDAENPAAGVTLGGEGVLYGTTVAGGNGSCNPAGCGTVFGLTTNTWIATTINELTQGPGAYPSTSVVLNSDGALYATDWLELFKLTPPASGDSWAMTQLRDLSTGLEGFLPSGLSIAANGTVYGTTAEGAICCGTVYRWVP